MLKDLIAITKSDADFFRGIWTSKKYFLTLVWLIMSVQLVEHWIDSNPGIAIHAIYGGAIVIAAYIFGQSFVEASAAKAHSKVPTDKPQ
jgi:hypothetical protein